MWILQEAGLRVLGHRLVHFEVTVRAGTSCMDDTFWDSFVIEMSDLFTKNKVFKQ